MCWKRGGLKGGGGGGGRTPTPASHGPPYPTFGTGNFLNLKSYCAKGAEEYFASNSGRGGGGGGGIFLWLSAVLIHPYHALFVLVTLYSFIPQLSEL